jgi:phage terminase large subunit GpA-like protein
VAGSTPLIKGESLIEELFEAGDQRRFHVPCPHCGHADILSFGDKATRGYMMRWADPSDAHFVCRTCAGQIGEEHKLEMLKRGEWIADRPGGTHASFHIWAAYSLSPNASWGALAEEYIEAKRNPTTLRTFMNTAAGESFAETGEAPAWEILYARREAYPIRTVPVEPLALTCGVDVQKDGLFYEVVAWLADKQSYSVEAGKLEGDVALDSTWSKLDELIARTFTGPGGAEYPIRLTAIDSSYDTQRVYNWARQYPLSKVIAIKGSATAKTLVGSASPVDITVGGKTIPHGYRVYSVGVDIAKSELYGYLRIKREGADPPSGYCHFPAYEGEFFQQLTAEHLVTSVNRTTGREVQTWHAMPNRPNHYLDCRNYARVAASVLGLDKYKPPPPTAPAPAAPAPAKRSWLAPRRGSWIKP